MIIWQFTVADQEVSYGKKRRKSLTRKGCNEPFKNRFWCPKQMWFMTEPCPFVNRRECENFSKMSGEKLGLAQNCRARNKN